MPDAASMRRFIERFAALIDQNAPELTELDAAIGDADHGINMQRGMRAVLERLPAEPAAPDVLLKSVATSLISKVGGASGPLYGTAFLRASTAVAGRAELEAPDVSALFRAALAGVIERGKAVRGDKTMVDAFEPAVDVLQRALDEGKSIAEALVAAKTAAQAGSDATVDLVARKGRASYLGERARGHRDPGSASTALLFTAAADTLGGP
jgi:phosphoenolpyruvate---glycerone phosphotransferase subunit DhaL